MEEEKKGRVRERERKKWFLAKSHQPNDPKCINIH